MVFYARYRQGSGEAGNVGAERIKHLVFRQQALSGVTRVRNPLPAQGGVEPESAAHAKLHAPFHIQEPDRAIIADDYRKMVLNNFQDRVQQAVATLSWMGAWLEVDVSIDPQANQRDVAGLVEEVEAFLYPRRRIGHLLRVTLPQYVSLEVNMVVCVKSGSLMAHVRQELLDLFSSRVRTNGKRGFFHPDNFTFGSELALSRMIAVAKTIEGVENVDVTRFQRRGRGDVGELAAGVMRFGPLEIPRLDNDPARPEFGRLTLEVRGLR
jgi:predicted phage baseplate assembly protein